MKGALFLEFKQLGPSFQLCPDGLEQLLQPVPSVLGVTAGRECWRVKRSYLSCGGGRQVQRVLLALTAISQGTPFPGGRRQHLLLLKLSAGGGAGSDARTVGMPALGACVQESRDLSHAVATPTVGSPHGPHSSRRGCLLLACVELSILIMQ